MASSLPPLTPELVNSEYFNETRAPTLIAVASVFIALNTFFVGLRFLSKRFQTAKLGWDDLFILLGWLATVGLCVGVIVGTRFGEGMHTIKVLATMPDVFDDYGRNSLYAIPFIWIFASTFPKLSVVVLYLRIFTDKLSRTLSWLVVAILTIAAIVNIFTGAFQCNVQEAAWNPTLPGGHCNDIEAHFTYASIPHIVTDIIMLILPIPVVRKLQISLHEKLGLAVIFVTAGLGLITAVVRLVEFSYNPFNKDPTFTAGGLECWTIVETSIYLICACLVTLRPVLTRFIQSTRNSSVYARLRRTSRSSQTKEDVSQTVHELRWPSDHPAGPLASAYNDNMPYSTPDQRQLVEIQAPGRIRVRQDLYLSSAANNLV